MAYSRTLSLIFLLLICGSLDARQSSRNIVLGSHLFVPNPVIRDSLSMAAAVDSIDPLSVGNLPEEKKVFICHMDPDSNVEEYRETPHTLEIDQEDLAYYLARFEYDYAGTCLQKQEIACYDFTSYSTGTFMDADHFDLNPNGTKPFADGKMKMWQIDRNDEKESLAWVVIREGTTPEAYLSSGGVINGCLGHLTNSTMAAGLGLFGEDESSYNESRDERATRLMKFKRLRFEMQNQELTSYFRIRLADFGDWNPFEMQDVTIILRGYNPAGEKVAEKMWSHFGHDLGDDGGAWDACMKDIMLQIHSDANDISAVELSFGANDEEDVFYPDPSSAIMEICFPSSEAGQSADDPHIKGFDGSSFDFRGHAGSIFNMITDWNFQVNAKFEESPVDTKTYMYAIGITVGQNQIYMDLDSLLLNGKPINDAKEHHLQGGLIIPEFAQNRVSIVTEAWTIVLHIVHWHHNKERHLNFDSSLNSKFLSNPHGILGQTAQYLVTGEDPHPKHAGWENENAIGIIEGSAEDYLVTDGLFGTEFTFNRLGDKFLYHKNVRARTIYGGAIYHSRTGGTLMLPTGLADNSPGRGMAAKGGTDDTDNEHNPRASKRSDKLRGRISLGKKPLREHHYQ